MSSMNGPNSASQSVPRRETATLHRSSDYKKGNAHEVLLNSTSERTYGVRSDYVTVEKKEREAGGDPSGAGFLRFDDRPGECVFTGAWGRANLGPLFHRMKSFGGCKTFTAYVPHLSVDNAQSLKEDGFLLRSDSVLLRQDPDGPTPPRVDRAGEIEHEQTTVNDLAVKTTTEKEVHFGRTVTNKTHIFTREGAAVGETTTSMFEDARQCYLGTLEVTGERGKGDGTKMLGATEDALKRDGCVHMWWTRSSFGDRPIDDEALGQWYRKRGGIQDGDTDTFHKPL